MTTIEYLALEVADPKAAADFYSQAFGLADRVRPTASEPESTGFRAFTLSLVVPQPGSVDAYIEAAVDAGATTLKPAAKSLWGYGGVVQAPDGAIVTVASGKKKDTGPAARQIDEFVLQLGVDDVLASKQFYSEHGVTIANSYGRRYVQFDTGPITLALYPRRALAKLAGVPADGSGSHRLKIASGAGSFTDPDGFEWEAASPKSAG